VDNVVMVGRLLVSMAVVLGIMWVLARRMRRGGGARGVRVIEVLDRTNLSRSASVAVVRVGERALVLGVADAQVSVLGETDLAAAQQARADSGAGKRTRGAAHRTMRVAAAAGAPVAPVRRDTPAAAPHEGQGSSGALAGSALSAQTWRQTIESLRDLTSRT
jgi:flagellar protein FliO/FliZ